MPEVTILPWETDSEFALRQHEEERNRHAAWLEEHGRLMHARGGSAQENPSIPEPPIQAMPGVDIPQRNGIRAQIRARPIPVAEITDYRSEVPTFRAGYDPERAVHKKKLPSNSKKKDFVGKAIKLVSKYKYKEITIEKGSKAQVVSRYGKGVIVEIVGLNKDLIKIPIPFSHVKLVKNDPKSNNCGFVVSDNWGTGNTAISHLSFDSPNVLGAPDDGDIEYVDYNPMTPPPLHYLVYVPNFGPREVELSRDGYTITDCQSRSSFSNTIPIFLTSGGMNSLPIDIESAYIHTLTQQNELNNRATTSGSNNVQIGGFRSGG